MAGPLNGIGGQQIPLSNTFKPGQNEDQVRGTPEDKKDDSRVRQTSANARTQESDTENREDLLEEKLAAALSAQKSGSGEVRRGSVVDITV